MSSLFRNVAAPLTNRQDVLELFNNEVKIIKKKCDHMINQEVNNQFLFVCVMISRLFFFIGAMFQ